jgi:hypothetical protein
LSNAVSGSGAARQPKLPCQGRPGGRVGVAFIVRRRSENGRPGRIFAMQQGEPIELQQLDISTTACLCLTEFLHMELTMGVHAACCA